MKTIITIIITLLVVFKLNAQIDTNKRLRNNEIYLTTNTFNSFGLLYKRQLTESIYLRTGSLRMYLNRDHYEPDTTIGFPSKNFNVGIYFILGLERRNNITSNLIINYGINLGILTSFKHTYVNNPMLSPELQKQNFIDFNYEIPFNFGFIYKINEFIYIGTEITPKISHYTVNSTNGTTKHIDLDFDTNQIVLSII